MAVKDNSGGGLPNKPEDLAAKGSGSMSPRSDEAPAPSRTPLLGSFGRDSLPSDERRGFVIALVVGAVALVAALMALTVAIGRTSPNAAAGPVSIAPSVGTTPAGPTTYPSPQPTGTRYTPQPIVIPSTSQRAPSYGPSYAPTPTATTSSIAARQAGNQGQQNPVATTTAAITFSWGLSTGGPRNPGNNNANPPAAEQAQPPVVAIPGDHG